MESKVRFGRLDTHSLGKFWRWFESRRRDVREGGRDRSHTDSNMFSPRSRSVNTGREENTPGSSAIRWL